MGTELDPTSPLDTDIVANYPQDERDERLAVKDLITKEHYEGAAGNDRHDIPQVADDTARDAVYASDDPIGPQSGNFNIQTGIAGTANVPRFRGFNAYDGTTWHKGLYLFTGAVIQCAFNPATIEADSEGALLPAFGGAFAEAGPYAELHSVIGNAFDTQNNVADPGLGNFRVPNIAGSMVIGISPDFDTPAAYMRNVSGQDDFRASGGYNGALSTIYIIKITVAALQDEFQFSSDGGATFSANIPIVAGPIAMDQNTFANFAADTGHNVGDTWIYVADPGLAVIGATGGASAWQLVANETPSHDHSVAIPSSGAHTHGQQDQGDNNSGDAFLRTTNDSDGFISIDSFGSDHTHTVSESTVGGDLAHFTTPRVLVFGSVIVT